MLALLGLSVASLLVIAYVYTELRSTWFAVTLSNGLDVLVNPEMYKKVVRRYAMIDEPDVWKRWDQAVLSVLRVARPREWEFLVRALGPQTMDFV